jgi:O-glycosyl hydrolase
MSLRSATCALALAGLAWAGCIAEAGTIEASHLEPASSLLETADGHLALRASGAFGVGTGYFGIAGGLNGQAIDDADGLAPADEWLEFEFSEEAGLASLEVTWTRARITISGFAADPQASGGTYDPTEGVWSAWQPWTGGAVVAYRFANVASSAGRKLRLVALDPNTPGPQVAVARFSYRTVDSISDGVPLEANLSQRRQVIDHFGASALWTIDPTEGWRTDTKERLALTLLSAADGIGLTNLRFDFGGGDTGTGTQTSQPWTWRFPLAMKDGPNEPFVWTRREGQQWFMRRARDLGLQKFTLASNSPPWWMTKNGRAYPSSSSGSTNLDPTKVTEYAQYLAAVIRHFRETEGIVFNHVSPINEPEWDWESGSQEGNRATAADIREVVNALHAELVAQGLDDRTRIFLGDHAVVNSLLDDLYHFQLTGGTWTGGNNGRYGKYREYLKDLHNHPEMVGKLEPVAGYHSYFTDDLNTLGGQMRSRLADNAAARGVGVLQSEFCILGTYGPGRNLQLEPARRVFRVIHKDLTAARSLGWNWWLALSPHDYKDGLVYTDFNAIGKSNPQLFNSKLLWTLGHFSRFIRPGFQQIGSGGHDNLQGLMSSSWLSPDGREVVIVAGNLSDQPIAVSLPTEVAGIAGMFLEWEHWVTDRGRNLRREEPVSGSTRLEPQSITTFVGRASDSLFRLRVHLTANSHSTVPGGQVVLSAQATYEDGLRLIPALDESVPWVFQPVAGSPIGELLAGRYYLRRLSDGRFLSLQESGSLALSGIRSMAAAWDVLPTSDSLRLVHALSGKGLAVDTAGVLVTRPLAAPLSSLPVPLAADLVWADNAGTGQTVTTSTRVTRWYEARARVGNDHAVGRLRVRVSEAPPILTIAASASVTNPGEPITLRAVLRDQDRPWRFRLAPFDRDEVVFANSVGEVEMTLPKGGRAEEWECVDPADLRVWPGLELGRSVYLRSVQNGRYLSPADDPSAGTSLLQSLAPGPGSLWTVERTQPDRHRIRHVASGLSLSISASTGKPALAIDDESGNSRFGFDSLDEDHPQIRWSHSMGSAPEQTVTPSRSTTYTVHVTRGGRTVSSSLSVLVPQSFPAWANDWFGAEATTDPRADPDGDGLSNLLEYALGSNPMVAEPRAEWPARQPVAGGVRMAWPRNPGAVGTWSVETSGNLLEWFSNPPEVPLQVDTLNSLAVELPFHSSDRLFVRLRFDLGD